MRLHRLSVKSDAAKGAGVGKARRGSEKKGYAELDDKELNIDDGDIPVKGNTGYGNLGGGGY